MLKKKEQKRERERESIRVTFDAIVSCSNFSSLLEAIILLQKKKSKIVFMVNLMS